MITLLETNRLEGDIEMTGQLAQGSQLVQETLPAPQNVQAKLVQLYTSRSEALINLVQEQVEHANRLY